MNGLCAEYHGQIGRILQMRMMKADKRLCLAVVGASLALCAKLSPFDVGAAEFYVGKLITVLIERLAT